MVAISIMIEGQMGLTWPRWERLCAEVEALGLAGLFRSDHFTGGAPPDQDPSPLRRLYDRLTLAPTDVGSRGTSWIAATPDIWRRLPSGMRDEIAYEVIQPMGSHWLPSRLTGVAIHTSRRVVSAHAGDGGLEVELDDGNRREVDHMLFATGYRVDLSKYGRRLPHQQHPRSLRLHVSPARHEQSLLEEIRAR